MSIDRIPVYLSSAREPGDSPIGFGVLEEGKLVITVDTEDVVNKLEKLLTAQDIRELYLGLAFTIPPVRSITRS